MVTQKPSFTTSAALVFTNLHNAAVEKAARAIGISPNGNNINQFIINSGMSDDGRTISDKNTKLDSRNRFSKDKYEVGIVLQYNATPVRKSFNESDLRKAKDKARDTIFAGLQEYFKWFAGDGKTFSKEDLVEFYPDYDGGKVIVNKGEIVGGDVKKHEEEDQKGHRIGYKVGYTINFK